ncbi:hypothetical protein [Maritimibacter dapengensis]|uniref:Uncharacterized protein n=1 Tax=Maritimibacter dapengensis TaxID=2836868 RepID=A0ABS6T1L0_9RHOB|nr:hypothetical protein [Maritimibacter dapengensis]MBV7378618.1 hypothetical protein [Maritimibacter dapengensis]
MSELKRQEPVVTRGQDRTPPKTGAHANETDQRGDHDIPDMFADLGFGRRRGIEEWLDWLSKKGEAGA